ncbi:hypothetical protein EUGRSUZ_G02712 [Eucalyptus grandis]|uniref:Uncharacterized protein n=2 Tax=Eucalyptus grandis TaxID=71139 RepID=A0ACC3K7X6_EUCGR|nr:hypothetical protein EUGRSUZ_G02712 [Eucalyptus grandis]
MAAEFVLNDLIGCLLKKRGRGKSFIFRKVASRAYRGNRHGTQGCSSKFRARRKKGQFVGGFNTSFEFNSSYVERLGANFYILASYATSNWPGWSSHQNISFSIHKQQHILQHDCTLHKSMMFQERFLQHGRKAVYRRRCFDTDWTVPPYF